MTAWPPPPRRHSMRSWPPTSRPRRMQIRGPRWSCWPTTTVAAAYARRRCSTWSAARRAQGEYANETALSYYQQALTLEDRWQWRQGQAEVLHILGRREEQAAALRALDAAPGVPA